MLHNQPVSLIIQMLSVLLVYHTLQSPNYSSTAGSSRFWAGLNDMIQKATDDHTVEQQNRRWHCSYPPNTTHRRNPRSRNSQPHRPLDQYSKSRVNQDRIPPTATTGTALNRSPLPVLNPPQYSVCVVMSWRHTWLFLDATQIQSCKSSSHAKINK